MEKNIQNSGNMLVIGMVLIFIITALAAALFSPVGTSSSVTDSLYAQNIATFAANSAAERVKFRMTQAGARPEDGTSQCVIEAILAGTWTPVSFEANSGKDRAGVTFPSLGLKNSEGNPIFDISVPDTDYPPLPEMPEVSYIVYSAEDGAGNAASYVSAEFNGEVRNIKVSYHKQFASVIPHQSYFHAVYAANSADQEYIFSLESETVTTGWGWWQRTVTYKDTVSGDIYVKGNADISEGDVEGITKATGTVTGNGNGEELPGVDQIDPPDLAKDGDWYQSLGLNENGTQSSNPAVVTDGSDGSIDNSIAGIIVPHTETGENQDYMDDNATSPVTYVLDSNIGVMAGSGDPTYHAGTDSVIVTVPDEYNNKAIVIPGDLWVDILNPTDIDFRSASGQPVSLTLIVEGNVYMTDGINTGVHPASVSGGLISIIALKRTDGNGGNVFYGDPSSNGVIDPIKAFMYAENNFQWFQDAQGAGDFDILGNMTAGEIIDFSARQSGSSFVPINVTFDPAILDPEIRENLPMLPSAGTDVIIPGTPYETGGFQYLE